MPFLASVPKGRQRATGDQYTLVHLLSLRGAARSICAAVLLTGRLRRGHCDSEWGLLPPPAVTTELVANPVFCKRSGGTVLSPVWAKPDRQVARPSPRDHAGNMFSAPPARLILWGTTSSPKSSPVQVCLFTPDSTELFYLLKPEASASS